MDAIFESRLRGYSQADPHSAWDKSWYALPNVIYAAGCQLTVSEGSTTEAFSMARAQSWGYYQSALAVHTDLLCSHTDTDLSSIQALLMMVEAYYLDVLVHCPIFKDRSKLINFGFIRLLCRISGNIELEYMVVSSAVQLAQS